MSRWWISIARFAAAGSLATALLLTQATAVVAQAPPSDTTSATLPPLPPPLAISPGGALWRAFLLPGWGHLSIGSYGRGAFYFGAQATTVYTLLRARTRIGETQDRVRLRESILRAAATREGVTDPDEIQTRLDADGELTELSNLLDSRQDQQEDLVAMTLFLILISGVDAYVSAHLARFPEPIQLEAQPSTTGGLDVGMRITLPGG
ncbi:MAG: DUF5683 domain-containing protein [Gemmatimonadota bacterium]